MANISYDPSVIHQFAESLYREAGAIVFKWTITGILLGALPAIALAMATNSHAPDPGSVMVGIIGCFIGGLAGYSHGQKRAFKLKLEAQLALCQVKIENNTSTRVH